VFKVADGVLARTGNLHGRPFAAGKRHGRPLRPYRNSRSYPLDCRGLECPCHCRRDDVIRTPAFYRVVTAKAGEDVIEVRVDSHGSRLLPARGPKEKSGLSDRGRLERFFTHVKRKSAALRSVT